ncbi:MAG: PAS domain-containing protein [Gammaproteobacteria bacterium]|nr:PAS domain-containing protein [Gammaproteobacteria bacterium]
MQRFLDAITPAHLRPLDSPARWWLAVLAVPAAALFSAAVHRITGGAAAPFSPFYLAVIVAAALGGVGPGLLTLVLTVLFVLTLGAMFFGPQWQLFATEPLTLAIFVAGGLVIVAITHQLQRSRVAARQVLARLEQLQADVGIRLWTVDLESGALRASGQPLRLDGRTPPSADGRLARDVWLAKVHADDRAGMLERLQRAIDTGESRYEYEVRVPQPDGSMRWINSYIHVHRDDDGHATHLSGAAVDVTPMRAARQAQAETEAQLRIITDSLPVLIGYATPDRRYRFNNRAYETWFGNPPEAVAGRTIEEVVGPAAYAGIRPHLDRAFAGETVQFRSRLDYGGLGSRDVAATYVPHVVDGRVQGIVILVEDVGGQIAGELRLRDSEERLRLAMEGARMGTWFSDTRTGRVVWDDAHLRLLGYDPQSPPSPSDALWRERVHPEDLPRVQAALDEAHRNVAPFDLERRIRRADDGTERWLALYGRYLRDGEQGSAHQSIGVVFDITARKQAELELERRRVELQTMLDLIPVGVAVAHDPRAEHITLSPRLAAMLHVEQHGGAFGEPQQQDAAGVGAVAGLVAGADVTRLPVARRKTPYRCLRDGRELTRDELPMRLAAIGGCEVRNAEFDVVFDDGEVLHLMSSAAPLFDARGQVRGVIGAHVDVTSFKRVQAALEQADRRKDEFLATLAHELRNPLAPIRYSARLLRPEAAPGVIAQVRDTIERQSTQMARLLDDLLDVSRITRNVIELRREPIDLRQAVEDSVEVARPLIDAVQHRLVLSLPGKPVWVEADRTRLSQVVSNLLQNAAKYTDPGGRIEVSVEQRQQDEALLRVRDSGIGIAPEMRERVFEIFSQVRRPGDGTRSGLGIGLAIVRRLVELHGGRIEVDSAGLGQGAEFIVYLPLAPPQTGLPLNVVPLFGTGRRRLLVVDDNRDAADSLGAMLRLSGHAVQVAYDGASAMALAETARPDVIVLDLGMPQTSGYDVARWIRRQPWGSGVRLIALTGWGQNEDRRRTREAGFDLHLTKPVDPDQLIAVLAEQGEIGEQTRK